MENTQLYIGSAYMKMPLKPLNVEEVGLVFVVCQMLWSSL